MDQSLVFEEHQLVFTVGVVVLIPASGLLRVFEKPAAPHRVVNFVRRGGDAVDPDFGHRRVALVVERPLAGARIELASAGGRSYPHVLAFHADAVDYVVAQPRCQLRVAVDASAGDAAQSAHGPGPYVTGALVQGQREHGAMRQAVLGGVGLPRMVLVNCQAVFRSRPDAVSINQHGENMIVGQAVGGGEVLKAEARQWLRRGRRRLRDMRFLRSRRGRLRGEKDRRDGRQHRANQERLECKLFHRVLKYSIRSLSSSLVRSLVRPCLSLGL